MYLTFNKSLSLKTLQNSCNLETIGKGQKSIITAQKPYPTEAVTKHATMQDNCNADIHLNWLLENTFQNSFLL